MPGPADLGPRAFSFGPRHQRAIADRGRTPYCLPMFRRANNVRDIQHGDVHPGSGAEPPLASHLVTPRALYTHHGIYVGNGTVVHYAGFAYGLRRGPVEQVSLERFARGRIVRIQPGYRRFDRLEVVERALSRVGESRYRLLTNNCEHFCAWALRDEWRSRQVEWLRALPGKWLRALRSQSGRITRPISPLHTGTES
jgi:lecithin:retinol acyltransferase